MSAYTPDDSIIEGEEAKNRIAEALKRLGGGVVTSRTAYLNDVLAEHWRPKMPPGVDQWQLPVKLDGPVFFFLSVLKPGAIVSSHEHKRSLFRVVVSGSVILEDGSKLESGDWMYVPAGTTYSIRAGLNPGAIIYHCYG